MKTLSSAALLSGAGVLLFTANAFADFDVGQHDKAQSVPPSVSSGACTESAMAYTASTDVQKTSSRNYRDVTGTSVSFTQGAAGCVEVSFTAEAATVPGERLITRVLMDGKACIPSGNIFASDSPSGDLADHGMNYICANVAAGDHTAKVQFLSRFGHPVALDYRTTIVRYAK